MSTIKFTVPNSEVEVTIDPTDLPEAIRARLIEQGVKAYVNGRINVAQNRYKTLLKAFEDDPTENDKPDAVDVAGMASAAKKDLLEGTVRVRGEGGGKTRQAKDPLDAIVTEAVVRELFTKRRAEDPKAKYIEVAKEVGASGIAFLTGNVERRANGDEAELKRLTAIMNKKYINPAKAMLAEAKDDADDLL